MSDLVSNYPSLRSEHLEILPNLSNRILYQDVPTSLPVLSSEEKANFLNTVVKCFIPDNTIEETKFRIHYLDNEDAPEAIKAISPQFNWVKRNQYSLLALMNFVQDLLSSSTTSTRSTTAELRDALNAVMDKDIHKPICDIMRRANPNEPTWDSLDYFINLAKVISRAIFLSIAKLHQGIVLNYQTFIFEAGLISLTGSYSQMVLGLASKDQVMEEARNLHQMRENVKNAYKDYLSLSNPNLLSFLKTIIPQISFSHTFDYDTYKGELINGSFGTIFHYQSIPLPLSCPQIKAMSENLDETISKINAFKATEQQIQEKLSHNIKENLRMQVDRWNTSKSSNPTISYMEVQLETFKSLKKEAISLSTKVE